MVCIASGGCNVMSYLTAAPAAITAVDLSPAHVALLRLKLAAALALPDHVAFYDLFGHADRPGNPGLYDRYIARLLDPDSRAWWEARRGLRGRRIDMFASGFYRHGALGRFIAAMHRVSRLGGVDFAPLLRARDLAEQEDFFETRIAPLFDNRIVKALARHPGALFALGIPPAQYRKLAADGDGDIVPVLRARMRKLICGFPVGDNYFLWAACNRGYRSDGSGPVPPYLEAGNFACVRAGTPRVQVDNAALTDRLAEMPPASQTAYVLLDAQDWMTDAQLDALWAQITRTAAPGARVLFRTGGAADILPGRVDPAILAPWRYDPETSASMTAADRSAIYGGVHLYRLAG